MIGGDGTDGAGVGATAQLASSMPHDARSGAGMLTAWRKAMATGPSTMRRMSWRMPLALTLSLVLAPMMSCACESLPPIDRPRKLTEEPSVTAVAPAVQPEITLTGRVFDALGRPFVDGWVWLVVDGGPSLEPQWPDESGMYEFGPFSGTVPGVEARLIVESYPGNARQTERFALPRAPARLLRDFHLNDFGVLRARVVDHTGAPIAHAVVFSRYGRDCGEHRADRAGHLELAALAPGAIVLEAFTPNGAELEPGRGRNLVAERTVEVVAGELVEVELRDRFAERRRVELLLRWPDGKPYWSPYDMLQVWAFEHGVPVAKAKPEYYEDRLFVDLPELEHDVLLVADGSIRQLGSVSRADVRAGRIGVTMQVGAILGTARDANGAPLASDRLVARWLDPPPHLARLESGRAVRFDTSTDEVGRFHFTLLSPGRWSITTSDGNELEGGPFELAPCEVRQAADVWLR
jgi:hypothetical protein